jgi:DNA repair protein RecO (recombination protein O)
MATYTIHAVNLGSFALGETDKVVTLFSAERGIVRAVAKGARKPGSKIAGRAEPLNVNRLLMAKGRNLDIITQAETIASFSNLRKDLHRLSYGLYYAELTQHFGHGLGDESATFFDFLCRSLSHLAESNADPTVACLIFELRLLDLLGIHPELDFCISCRDPLTEYRLSFFNHESCGIVCDRCFAGKDKAVVQEQLIFEYGEDAPTNPALKARDRSPYAGVAGSHITPLVWKKLVLMAKGHHEGPTVHTSLQAYRQASTGMASSSISPDSLEEPASSEEEPSLASSKASDPAGYLSDSISQETLFRDSFSLGSISEGSRPQRSDSQSANAMHVNNAARRLVQHYLEHKAGRRMRALDLIR